jgi:8-oxo-dGTP pyrophosphatase MutT (NUDIX family)
VELEIRESALCLFRRYRSFLVAELIDPVTGKLLHRPPGGGLETGESPEDAVRREILEELGVRLGTVEALGPIDHVWFWKGREVRERAWVFLSDSACDERLSRGDTPEILEANGERIPTVWRPVDVENAPPLCPSTLARLLAVL